MLFRLGHFSKGSLLKMSHINTKCVQEGYEPKSGEPRVLPIYQSTTFKYEDAKTLGDLFDFNASITFTI